MDNLRHFAGSVQQSREINLFLKMDVDAAAAAKLAQTLEGRADVASVEVRTPEQALAAFRESSGLGEAIDALGENPLPTLLIVVPDGGSGDATLLAALETLPQADLIQHDAVWRQRLDAWLASVSYTHLDVYKRQALGRWLDTYWFVPGSNRRKPPMRVPSSTPVR